MTSQSSVRAIIAFCVLTCVGELTDQGPLLLGGNDAQAVVGRPLTPVSYAGVARRTSRRTTRRHMYASGAYGYGYPAGTVAALPAGCMFAGGLYTCGAVRYRPYYSGTTIVYQTVQ